MSRSAFITLDRCIGDSGAGATVGCITSLQMGLCTYANGQLSVRL
jgi:hypothetical protein